MSIRNFQYGIIKDNGEVEPLIDLGASPIDINLEKETSGMNLQKLFEIQSKLDERIVQEHGLQGQDLLGKKILALQVEIGELANEARFFKFWSKDQKPRLKEFPKGTCYCKEHDGYWCDKLHESEAEAKEIYVNPLLEEYVDCLHFILSIGLEMGYTFTPAMKWQSPTVTEHFNALFCNVSELNESIEEDWAEEERQNVFDGLMSGFLGLGDHLGFTEQKIYDAYLDKNKINHTRQDVGY